MKLSFDFDRTGLEHIKIILHIKSNNFNIAQYSIFTDGWLERLSVI